MNYILIIAFCFFFTNNIIYFLKRFFNNLRVKTKRFIKRVGIIGLEHSMNIGNNLLKYAISIKISELGYIPYIIGKKISPNLNLSLIFNEIMK